MWNDSAVVGPCPSNPDHTPAPNLVPPDGCGQEKGFDFCYRRHGHGGKQKLPARQFTFSVKELTLFGKRPGRQPWFGLDTRSTFRVCTKSMAYVGHADLLFCPTPSG